MGVLGGSFFFLQSIPPPFLSSSSRSKNSFLFYSPQSRNGFRKRNMKTPAMASLHHDSPNSPTFLQRRGLLFLGVSVLSFLESKAKALADLGLKGKQYSEILGADAPKNVDHRIPSLQKEQIEQVRSLINPFVGLLNGLGVFGIGILGAFYALAWKEKTEIESTIVSMKTQLKEKDAAMATLEKNFGKRIQNEQEEKIKQIRQAKEEQTSLLSQLASMKTVLMGLQKELQSEKKLAQELRFQREQLERDIEQANDDKKILEDKLKEKQDTVDALQGRMSLLTIEMKDKEMDITNLMSSLTEKESECRSLASICEKTKADLEVANSDVEQLKAEVLQIRKELDSKISSMKDLNTRVNLLLLERDGLNEKFHSLEEEYNTLKSFSEKQIASYSDILSGKDHELHQLKEKLRVALTEVSNNQEKIANLKQENVDLSTTLENEVNTARKLRNELQLTQEALGASRLEAADLSKQLKQSKISEEELISDISRIQAEFAGMQKSLSQSVEEERSTSEKLSGKLESANEALKKTKQELAVVTKELKDAKEGHENLKKELLEMYKKDENVARELEEERKVVASWKMDLEALKKQIVMDKEVRRSLETDLKDATRSLDEMNKNTLLLSRELEIANSRTASLESEKDMLYKSFMEQKDTAKEAKDNLEDAQNVIMRLGSEREELEKKGKKLEEELAVAKGEILLLRREKNLTRTQQPKSREAEVGTPVVEKKNVRRRKSDS